MSIDPTESAAACSPTSDVPRNTVENSIEYDQQHLKYMVSLLRNSDLCNWNSPSELFHDMRTNRLSKALYEVLAERKEDLASLIADRVSENTHNISTCSQKLDNMLFECLTGAELGPPSPEPGESPRMSDDNYKQQLASIKSRHKNMLQELEQLKEEAKDKIDHLVDLQMKFRPITKDDHQRLVESAHNRFGPFEECIKKKTVNDVMIINNKCLDARRRRRNFDKETTEILTKYFNEHIDHPYPSDEEKQKLAQQCGMTVQQVSNWFGNRRIRQKKQADRPLQPPPKKRSNNTNGTQAQPVSKRQSSTRQSESTPLQRPELPHDHVLHRPQIAMESTPMIRDTIHANYFIAQPSGTYEMSHPPALMTTIYSNGNTLSEESDQISSIVRSSMTMH